MMEVPDVINQLLNIVAPPLACFTIWISLSSFRTLKRFLSLLSFFFSNEDVAGHVILITGASSGIGEHLAYEYARKGACLVLAARREERGREIAGRCLELGSPDAIFLRTDVSDVADCKLAIDSTIAHFGKLDHLMSNAGIVSVDMLEDCDDVNNLRSVMDINFWGFVYITRFAIPHLRRSKGKITVISSASSWLPLPRMGFYNVEKAFDGDGNLKQPKHLSINKVGHALHKIDPVFHKISGSEKVCSMLSSLGYKKPAIVQSMYIIKRPGIGGEVVPHQDNSFLYTEPTTCTGLWLALEDATMVNGCLRAIPGSNKNGLVRRFIRGDDWVKFDKPSPTYDQKDFVPVEVKAGSLVVIHCNLIHQSFENQSPLSRHAYIMHVVDTEGCKWAENNWIRRKSEPEPLYAS